MNHTAAAAVPTVPATVTASGETPRATSQRPIGVVTRLTCARAKRLSIDSCSVPGGGLSRVARS